jgi:CRP-like cAMP-binding protein
MHPLKAYMSLQSTITNSDWQKIEPFFKYRIVQTNRIILKPGAICQHIYFLENGNICFFSVINEEEEITHEMHPPCLFTSVKSFTEQIPSTYGIRVMEESYLWEIGRSDAYKLLEVPSWSNFISKL